MLTGSAGAWEFRSPYSTMDQAGVLAYLPYLLLGKLAAGPGLHEQLVVIYHLFRILVTPFSVFASYKFISLFLKGILWRKWATILATVGGGLGWVLVILRKGYWFESFPMDWISPEWFGFLAYFGFPRRGPSQGPRYYNRLWIWIDYSWSRIETSCTVLRNHTLAGVLYEEGGT